jgi:molybdopterin-guanine dinucleotide biosynthesis protein A
MVIVLPARTSTAAAILAGGAARRFGGHDKSRLVVEGRTIIIRQMEILQQVAGEIFIVSPFADRFADLHVPVHPDRIAGLGAIGGIFTALEVAQSDCVLVVACDLPFLDARLLGRLIELSSNGDGAWVRSPRGVEPLLACYRREARAAIGVEIAAGRLKAGELGSVLRMAELAGKELERFGPVERLLANLNTPEDLARLR